ncbi:MAG: 2OG-Fe(II) oxygenase [Methylotenera sp.]|nr:2OG-Fe(II) oxygenase [Methylotenera sp.]
MLSQYIAHNLEEQLNKITEHGFCVMDDFMLQASILVLADEISALNAAAHLHKAGTGKSQINLNEDLRGDSICWLNEANASVAQLVYFKQMEKLRVGLNEHLYLGLFALESHLALYPIGAGYKKHIDRFKIDTNTRTIDQAVRQVSCILYLNQDWLEEDGGHLRLYLNQADVSLDVPPLPLPDITYLDIAPIGGRLVMFLSDTFYHEVLAATRNRASLTGWFLTR